MCNVNAYGEPLEPPIAFSANMEDLLVIALAQRREIPIVARLSPQKLARHQATPSQMENMVDAWRRNFSSWMSTRSLDEYWDLRNQHRNQDAHQFRHRLFRAHLRLQVPAEEAYRAANSSIP